MKQNRRNFLKTSALFGAGLSGISTRKISSQTHNQPSPDRMGVLVDTTVCIGCRKCEWACKNAHNIQSGDYDSYEDKSVFAKMRRPDDQALTVVNSYEVESGKGESDIKVKVQCMHCDQPACVSACIVGAFSKLPNGAVVWDTGKCIGCRYCMVACPFQIPAFEFGEALSPDIKKCDFCIDRTKNDLLPACVEICPVEALIYGKRSELIRVAHEKISNYPLRYINKVYGEFEVGGTSWMYLASRDFTSLDFPKLTDDPAPGVSESIQHGIFAYFIPPISLYALLGGVMWLNKKRESSGPKEEI